MSNGVTHGELVLFDCPRIRRSEYWQFIKLVAPARSPSVPGQTHWLSQDASDAFCLKCSKIFRFQKGSSNSVRRHMERFHRRDLAKYHAQAQAASSPLGRDLYDAGGVTKKAQRKAKRAAASTTPGLSVQELSHSVNSADEGVAHSTPHSTSVRPGEEDGLSAKKRRTESFAAASEQRDGVELLLAWLSAGMRPLSVVEDAGFAEFATFLSSGHQSAAAFEVPTFDTLQHRLALTVESLRFEARQRLKKELGQCSLSAEVWLVGSRGRETRDSDGRVMAISCHYLDVDFTMITAPLEIIDLPDNFDQNGIRDMILENVREWGLHKQNVSLVLGAQDIGDAIAAEGVSDVVDLRWVREFVTSLVSPFMSSENFFTADVPISAAMATSKALVGSTVKRLYELVEAIHRDGEARKVVQEQHQNVADGAREFDWPCDLSGARGSLNWIEVGHFLGRIIAWKPAFEEFFAESLSISKRAQLQDIIQLKPSTREWYVVEALILLLHPLQELFGVLGTEKVTSVPFLIPCVAMMKQQLLRDDLFAELHERYRREFEFDDEIAFTAMEHLREFVVHRFCASNDTILTELRWCSALDPRCARMRTLSDEGREKCKTQLTEQAIAWHASQLPTTASDPIGTLGVELDGDIMYSVIRPGQGLMHRLLYDDDEEAASSESLSREAEMEQIRLSIANEVSSYCSEHQARKTRILHPLEWWRNNRERFPLLAPLARIWLGAVASTGRTMVHTLPLEVVEENRRRGVPRATHDMIFLHTASSRARVAAPLPSARLSPEPAAATHHSPPFAV